MFGSIAGGDDRSSFRTLGVGRRILDAGYKSIPVSHVAAVTIYRPSRFGFVKLFFALCAVVAGALLGLFFFVPPTWSVPIGAAIGLLVGLIVFIPSRPTCLLIAASDGSGAVFESRDIAFLRQCKAFIDAKINESRLDATGFFDFETSRFEPLAENGERTPAAPQQSQAEPPVVSHGTEPVVDTPVAPPTEILAQEPAHGEPNVSSLSEDMPPPPATSPAPDMGAIQNAAGAGPDAAVPPPAQPQDQGLAIQNDGYDALRNALIAAGGTPPPSPVESGLVETAPVETVPPAPQAPVQAQPATQAPSQPMPALDFGNAMAQVQQVRRFYEETVQNPNMVQRLDVMVDIMHSGAANERDRADLILIAEEIESNLTTYPSIAAIFRRVANQARTGAPA